MSEANCGQWTELCVFHIIWTPVMDSGNSLSCLACITYSANTATAVSTRVASGQLLKGLRNMQNRRHQQQGPVLGIFQFDLHVTS
jgi:hypothetical protein